MRRAAGDLGEAFPLSGKLRERADLIRIVYATGLASQTLLAAHFNVSVPAICKIVHGVSYPCGGDPSEGVPRYVPLRRRRQLRSALNGR